MQRICDHLNRPFPAILQDCKSDERIFYIDVIRAFAITMVVLLHTAAIPMKHFSTITTSEWWISNLIFSSAHQGVPLFIMISGLLLLNTAKEETLMVFFRKRMKKVIIPFVFWGVVYYCWRIFFMSEKHTIHEALGIFIKGPIYYHLWFIYVILGLYLATPILRVYIKIAPKPNVIYFVTSWFLFASLLPVFSSITGMRVGIHVVIFTGNIGYFLLGHLLGQLNFSKKFMWLIAMIAIGAVLFTALGTHYITILKGGQYNNFFVKITRPNIIVLSICMFLLLSQFPYVQIFPDDSTPVNIIRYIAAASFGIYFLHPMVLELLDAGWLGFRLSALSVHTAVGVPTTFLATLVISFILVTVLKQIPLIKMVVP